MLWLYLRLLDHTFAKKFLLNPCSNLISDRSLKILTVESGPISVAAGKQMVYVQCRYICIVSLFVSIRVTVLFNGNSSN
jgi:hypothetical protein